MAAPSSPDFRSPRFLAEHALWVMQFYRDRAVDPSGGMYHYFLDDGAVYDRRSRHLVSATRFAITYAIGYELGRERADADRAQHAIDFVRKAFRDPDRGGFAWTLHWQDGEARVIDPTRHMYGLAFVMLAGARALRIGIDGARGLLDEAFTLAERHFFDPRKRLYADEATLDWRVSDYRGQNSNMHACDAMMAAFAATGERCYLERAEAIADAVTNRLAAFHGGDICEHYRIDWSPDWDFNRDDQSNIFRPWGYQPGHFTEWAKILCQLDTLLPAPWHLARARWLFDRAVGAAWDATHQGLHYGFAPDGSICAPEKYHWVQAESFAAAALLAVATGEPSYWTWYDRLWRYCWRYFVDHHNGAWFRILTRDNLNLTREKSPAGKVDYHNVGACFDVWQALQSGQGQGWTHLPKFA